LETPLCPKWLLSLFYGPICLACFSILGQTPSKQPTSALGCRYQHWSIFCALCILLCGDVPHQSINIHAASIAKVFELTKRGCFVIHVTSGFTLIFAVWMFLTRIILVVFCPNFLQFSSVTVRMLWLCTNDFYASWFVAFCSPALHSPNKQILQKMWLETAEREVLHHVPWQVLSTFDRLDDKWNFFTVYCSKLLILLYYLRMFISKKSQWPAPWFSADKIKLKILERLKDKKSSKGIKWLEVKPKLDHLKSAVLQSK